MNNFLLWLVGISFILWMWGVVRNINKQLKGIKMTLDDVLADVQAEATLVGGLSDFVAGLKKQLDEALANQIPPETQAKVDAIFAAVEDNKSKVAEAMASVPPGGETPPPTP